MATDDRWPGLIQVHVHLDSAEAWEAEDDVEQAAMAHLATLEAMEAILITAAERGLIVDTDTPPTVQALTFRHDDTGETHAHLEVTARARLDPARHN